MFTLSKENPLPAAASDRGSNRSSAFAEVSTVFAQILGIEPRPRGLEALVLPLHHIYVFIIANNYTYYKNMYRKWQKLYISPNIS